MAERDGGVACEQQHADRLTEDGAAAHHHSVAAGELDVISVEQANDASGCARVESRLAECHRGEAVHGDPVDVLGWVDGLKGCAFIDVGGHWMLQQNAVDGRVSRQIRDVLDQLSCGRGYGKFNDDRADTVLLTTSTLHRDIGPRPRIVADQHCGKHRLSTRHI